MRVTDAVDLKRFISSEIRWKTSTFHSPTAELPQPFPQLACGALNYPPLITNQSMKTCQLGVFPVIRTLKWFLQNSRTASLRSLVLGGMIAISPTLLLAADKDKDNDRPNRHGPASSAQQMESGKSLRNGGGQTMSFTPKDSGKNGTKGSEAKRMNQEPDFVAKKKFDGTDQKKFDRTIDPKTMVGSGRSNSGDEQKKRGNSRADDLNKKVRNSDEPKKFDQIPDLSGKNKPRDNNGKERDGNSKDLSEKGGKKLVNPEDLKKFNKHPEVVKPLDLDKKTQKDGDFKVVHGDSKNGDGKKVGNFLDQHKNGKFDGIVKGAVAKKIDLGKQFELKHKGDLTLKLNLEQKIKMHGGWSKSHWAGLIGPGFGAGCSPIVYCGPGYFPSHCLYPGWSPWVEYCWGFRFDPICDPRPWFCRPWVYDPCPIWVRWDYPVWYELPVVACGTWVDVQPVVIDDGLDLQLLAVRFVDPGQPELREGPRYRVWARNNSDRTIVKDFNILLMAANSRETVADLPQAGVRVDSMEPGEIKAFDVRLPFESTMMARDAQGNVGPFSQLHVLVDSHREVPEAFEENNGAVIARCDVLPVDPVIFGTDSVTPVPGTEINIAGEGFGPEPGQVLVHVGGIELQAEIEGWYDLGVRVKVPALALAGPTDAELVLVRGDTAASNPLTVQLTLPIASR
jgi:hypothetical protein